MVKLAVIGCGCSAATEEVVNDNSKVIPFWNIPLVNTNQTL